MPGKTHQQGLFQSLSARRAWIEISPRLASSAENVVALRKESVDRNVKCSYTCCACYSSLSARRAWIEITVVTANDWASVVALRKESVDRNDS